MYTVTSITKLTPTHISVLLSDDVAYDVDREAFWEYITEGTGKYMYVLDHYEPQTGHRQTEHVISYDDYWRDAIGSRTVKEQVNEYIQNDESTQLDIDVKRAWQDFIEWKDMVAATCSEDLANKILWAVCAHETAIKNQITYQNK